MEPYRHHVSGFFAPGEDAGKAFKALVERGLPRARLHLLESGTDSAATVPYTRSKAVLKDVVVDGAIGAAVGTGVGALAEVALVVANVSLFIASPLVAPLAMLGWGASLGGLVGAAVGAESKSAKKDGTFLALVRDAVSNNQVVVLAETRTPAETEIARQVIQAAVGEFNDVATA